MDCVKVQKCPAKSSTLYCRSPYGKSEGSAPSAAHCRRMAPSPLREESILQLSRRQSAARVSSTFLYLFNSLLVIRFSLSSRLGRSVECPGQYSAQRQAYYKSSALGRFSPYVAAVIEHSLAGER